MSLRKKVYTKCEKLVDEQKNDCFAV